LRRTSALGGSCELKADTNRAEEPKKWEISRKFINDDFVSFLSFLIPLEESDQAKNQRPITGEGSVQEWANDYQLRILHSIDLTDILKLLADKGHVEIHKEENSIIYRHQAIEYLVAEINARIKRRT
jgi:hypothetical protein